MVSENHPALLFPTVSGGHINPAVSIAFAVIGRFSWLKVPLYSLAQTLGAFLAAACVYGVYIGECHSACKTEQK